MNRPVARIGITVLGEVFDGVIYPWCFGMVNGTCWMKQTPRKVISGIALFETDRSEDNEHVPDRPSLTHLPRISYLPSRPTSLGPMLAGQLPGSANVARMASRSSKPNSTLGSM